MDAEALCDELRKSPEIRVRALAPTAWSQRGIMLCSEETFGAYRKKSVKHKHRIKRTFINEGFEADVTVFLCCGYETTEPFFFFFFFFINSKQDRWQYNPPLPTWLSHLCFIDPVCLISLYCTLPSLSQLLQLPCFKKKNLEILHQDKQE